jgi:intracellular sulfur oxidation DsrE/DsrF family protein
MRYLIAAGALALLGGRASEPVSEPYRVVFDLTSRDSLDQRAVLRWINETRGASPSAEALEVVMYGKGFELVMPERSIAIADVEAAIKSGKATFKVCAIAMKNNRIEKSQLLPGVEIVPDGIREIMLKQQDHWGYIKVGH